MSFGHQLYEAVRYAQTPLGIGLDPHLDRLPRFLRQSYEGLEGEEFCLAAAEAIVAFNEMVLDAAVDRVAAVKPQFAFYEQLGSAGFAALEATCEMARERNLLVIGDAKRGDISSTGAAYARSILSNQGPFKCDAVTLNPWMGLDTLDPFLKYVRSEGKGLFVLLRTTNPGSALLQHHGLSSEAGAAMTTLASELNAIGEESISESGFSSIGVVVGASAAEEAAALRQLLPSAWFLVPGMGAQGGSAAQALAGRATNSYGSLVVCSRSLLFPQDRSDYDQKAKAVRRFVRSAITETARTLHQ